MANAALTTIEPERLRELLRHHPQELDRSVFSTIVDRERWPAYVHYTVGLRARITYTPPDSYTFTPAKPSPSDCVWIVPGTTP